MANVTVPYFFDEFLHPVSRKEPTPRERALGFTVKDLNWLHTLYYATDTARRDTTLNEYPMLVERLLINPTGTHPTPLAGAFVISPTPDEAKAVLYTPYKGLELFDSHTALLNEVDERLRQPAQRSDLLRFLSIDEQDALPLAVRLTATTSVIQGAVMEDQQQAILDGQQKNVAVMLDELRKLPSLHGMLDTLLGIMARPYFPGLNQRDTRVSFFSRESAAEDRRWVTSEPLRDALLRFYVNHAWPTDQTHTFSNIGLDTATHTPEQQAQDQQRWDSVIEQTSGILSTLLNSLLQTYWNEDFKGSQSRRRFFSRVISDKCRVDLLFKQQEMILSADQSQKLRALFLPDQAARTASDSRLSVEKVRIHAPFQHYVDLASTLMISNSHAYLYTQSRGLQVLADLNDLNDALLSMLKTAGHEDELLNFLSVDERSVFVGMNHIQVTGKPVAGDVFQEIIEDIIAKQFDNLETALGLFRRSAGGVDLAAQVESALDVRTMLDSRLLEQETDGRWSIHPITTDSGRPTTVQAEKSKLHLQRLQAIEAAMAEERSRHLTLSELAAHALDTELTKRQLELKADEVHINTYPTQALEREVRTPEASSSMVEHFIARLARQTDALSESTLTWFYGDRHAGVAYKLNNLTFATFNSIIEQALGTFSHDDLRALPTIFLKNNQAHLSLGMLRGLSGEAQMRRLHKSLPAQSLALLDSVLDADHMTRMTRHGLNGFIPDAFGLTLKTDSQSTPQPLANCFVLTERGGTDPIHSGTALLWTPRNGYQAYGSIKALRQALEQGLQDPLKRLTLLENLPISKRVPHQTWQLGPLRRIDDDLLHDRQRSYSDFTRDEIDHLFSMKLNAKRFQDCMDSIIQRAPPTNLPRAIAIAQALINLQALPVWLGMASPREQRLHAELLEQYRISAPDERDYLHNITPLRDAAVSALSTLLEARFPGQSIHPDNVLIPNRIDLKGNAQTLTDFALRYLPELHAEDIRPQSRTAAALPEGLNGDAIVQLVRQVDLKSTFQKLLTTHLKDQTEDSRERRQLFCRQLPWQLLHYAHQQTLDERLSASAWGFIQHVFDMPDALARAAVAGVTAIIRPLELLATPGAALVKALGCYLIGPKAGASGPLILYAPYSPIHGLKEYANEAAFLNELTTPGALQDWVVGQLEAPEQATYRNLLNEKRRHEHSEISFGATPIAGNLLKQLFEDNAEMLQRMLASQFSRSGQAAWDAVTSLLTQEIPKGLQFLAGKLAYPLAVWRSYKLFKTSAEDLQQHRWQHALKTFIAGVAALASLREGLDQLLPQTPVPKADVKPDDVDLTAPWRTELQAFEQHDIALRDLELSAQSHLYRGKTDIQHFVSLAGKVYPVKSAGERWRLNQDELQGPYIQRDAKGAWVLDLDRHHPLYGKTLSRFSGKVQTRAAERDSINIEARGMREIAALSPWKAQCIAEALNVATCYTATCKLNLLHFATHLDPLSRIGRFFGELFGIVTMTPAQLGRIKRRIDEVLNELGNPTLINPDSTRFVSGTHRYNPRQTFAFVIPKDPDQKIYLLDRFFDPPMDIYQNHLNTAFDIMAHARATILIHEITHLKSQTEDLAYLDSMRPFPDLIKVSTPRTKLMQTDLSDLRLNALSLMTPVRLLFKTWDDFSQAWEDFGSSEATSSQKAKVLSTTGCRTLVEARSIFMSNADKRIDTILANADSVTYMISELGRKLDIGA